MWEPAKDSLIFQTKYNDIYVIVTFFNFSEMLTNDAINFEELAPGHYT